MLIAAAKDSWDCLKNEYGYQNILCIQKDKKTCTLLTIGYIIHIEIPFRINGRGHQAVAELHDPGVINRIITEDDDDEIFDIV